MISLIATITLRSIIRNADRELQETGPKQKALDLLVRSWMGMGDQLTKEQQDTLWRRYWDEVKQDRQ